MLKSAKARVSQKDRQPSHTPKLSQRSHSRKRIQHKTHSTTQSHKTSTRSIVTTPTRPSQLSLPNLDLLHHDVSLQNQSSSTTTTRSKTKTLSAPHLRSHSSFSTATNPIHKPKKITAGDVYMNPRLEPEPYSFARRMMTYWFQDYERGKVVPDECRKKWFVGHPVLDKYMVYEFGADFEAYRMEKLSGNPGPYSEIERHPLGALSLIILIQQYPKSALRLAKAENGGFLTPDLVVNSQFGPTSRLAHDTFMEMVYNSIQMLHPLRFDVIERIFFFLPLLQMENRSSQKIATARFSDLVEEAPRMHKPLLTAVKEFGLAHLDVIQQFGRFPQRNELSGRDSTPEELEYLRMHTSDWEPIKIYQFVKDEALEGKVNDFHQQFDQQQLQSSGRSIVENELPMPIRNPSAWRS